MWCICQPVLAKKQTNVFFTQTMAASGGFCETAGDNWTQREPNSSGQGYHVLLKNHYLLVKMAMFFLTAGGGPPSPVSVPIIGLVSI